MDAAAPRRPRAAFAALLLLLVAATLGFAALGVWQLERLAWKEDLVARVDARIHATPVSAPGPAEWSRLTREAAEYRRVQVQGRFDAQRQVTVAATTDLGAGYWVLTPLQRHDGSWLLVNRGFVPPGQRGAIAVPAGDVSVVGLLRWSEPKGAFLRDNRPAEGRWYSRDVPAISQSMRLPAAVAPYFIDAQAVDGATGGWPRPGLTVVRFPNNHLGYALTWFAMAAGSIGAAVLLWRDARRRFQPASSLAADHLPS